MRTSLLNDTEYFVRGKQDVGARSENSCYTGVQHFSVILWWNDTTTDYDNIFSTRLGY